MQTRLPVCLKKQTTVSFVHTSVKRLLLMMYLIAGTFFISNAQSPQANLDQGNNGNLPGGIHNPVDWVNGNLNESQNHYIEGQSIPYRAILDRIKVGCTTKIRIAFDARRNSHMAIDFLTSNNWPGLHNTVYGHAAEAVNPLLGLSGTFSGPLQFPLPAPGSANTPVPGQPTNSFNAIPLALRQMEIYNGTILNIQWITPPNYDEANASSEAVLEVTFVASALPAVLTWGGHIASRIDWGFTAPGQPRSAGGISGSPYHMRLVEWSQYTPENASGCPANTASIGSQDRSLQISAPPCDDIIADIAVNMANYEINNTIGLNVNVSGGFPPYTYLWSSSTPNVTINNPNIQNPTATVVGPASTVTFTVLVTDAIGCQVTQTITQSLTPRPCGINGPSEVCPGTNATFTFPYGGATSLTWQVTGDGNFNGANTGNPIEITAAMVCGGSYTVIVTAVFPNETKVCSTTVIVLTPPQATFNNLPGNISIACSAAPPQPTVLSFTNNAGCLIAGTVTSTINGNHTFCGGAYTETWTFIDLCNRTISHSRVITVSPAPRPTFIDPPGNITLTSCNSSLPATTSLNYTNTGTNTCLISGQTPPSVIELTSGAAPCQRVYTETWTVMICGVPLTHSRTITVPPAPQATFAFLPGNETVSCTQVPAAIPISYSNGLLSPCTIEGIAQPTRTGGHTICGGTYTDTWSFTDPCGRGTTTHSRTITVQPAAIAAFVDPPGNITVACGGAPAPTCLNYTNSGGAGCLIAGCVTSTRTATPGVCGGTITETWTFTDACQRTITHSRTITVQPAAIAAFINPPGNITVACGGAPAPTCLAYSNGATAGGCLIAGCVTSTRTTTPGVCGGVITETWSFTDECQRNITHSRTITVQPAAIAAFVNPPGNITVACGGAPAPTCLNYTNGGGAGCLIAGCVTSTRTATPGLCGGVITETWSFTDECQRNITHSRTITVQPAAIAAFVNPPGNITVACGGAPAPSCLAYTNGATAGGCLIAGCVTSTRTATPGLCGGVITETWSFTDECQRNITHSRTITVQPAAIAAFVNPPGNITVACGGAPAPTCLAYTNGGGAGCLIAGCVTSTRTATPGLCGGVITETWTFVDECQRTTSHNRTITVEPAAVAAFVNPPGNITVTCGGAPAPTCLAYTNGGGAGCLIAGCVTSTRTETPGVCGGTITETWSFRDQCERLITHSRTITVQPAAIAAFVNPPGNITVACGGAPSPTCLAYTNGGGAGCLIAGCVTSTRTATPGLCGGVITETWSFTDQCQRNITHSRTITVQPAAIAAFVDPPGNITVACGGAPAPTCLAYTNGGGAGCLIAGCVTSTRTATPGLCGGVITETWSFTDECQRNISHSRTITVQPAAIAAFVNPPGNITVACGGAPAPTCLAYSNGATAGGCLIAGCVTSTRTATPGLCGGVITETWTFTDECQRTISHNRTITVEPAAVAAFVNPPGNITVACGGAPAPTCLAYTNGRTAGGCLIAGCVTSTRTTTPGLCGGVITETWSFTDECQRNITHSRTITVQPAAIAAFVNPPGNITVACGGAPAPTCLNYTNSGGAGCLIAGCVTSTRTATPGLCGGVITETWSFTDECQRNITHSRTITVQPAAIAAFVNPPANINVSCGNVPGPSCLNYTNGGGAGCLIAGCVTSTRTSSTGLCGGVITETWTFTDECQRTISHSRTITVPPTPIAAFVNPPGNITVACGGAPAPTCLAYTNNATGGQCLIAGCVTSTRTATPGVCGGVITETWTFVDECQRTISHSRTITVEPAPIAAFVNPPGNVTVACGGAPAPTCLAYTNGRTAGGCLIAGCVTSTRTATPGLCGGVITETWSFTDECQRNITHSRTITVQPAAIAAFVNPPGNITVACGGAPAPTCLAYSNGATAGGCLIAGCVTSTRTATPGLCGGVITETWTFVDECQRTISHNRTITVEPAAIAAFVNPPGNVTVACGGAPAPTCLAYTNGRTAGGCLIAGCVTSTRTATPGLCGGVITETWSFTDECQRNISHSRTITVQPAAIAAFVNPPGNITVACGGAPAPTCLTYTNGGDAGCLIAGCVTSTRTATPGLCGGVITETWSFTDECQRNISHSRTITVEPAAIAAFVNPPGDITVACGGAPAPTCLAYTNGRTAGGCLIAGCVTSTRTATPGVCGGVITETWSFTDECQRNITHSRTITVQPAAIAAFVNPPGNITVACGGAPAPSCLNYTNGGGAGCLIAGCVTSTRTTAPGLCGGIMTETWTFVDECQRTISHSRTITVQPAAIAAFVNPPGNITVACGGAPAPTCLAYTNGGGAGCLIAGCVTSTRTETPGVCGGTITETWSFRDQCERLITHSRTITVQPAAIAAFVNPPGNITVACGGAPAPTCLTYTNGGGAGCLIAGCVTSTRTATPGLCGGVITETWSFTDQCQRNITHSRTITVQPAAIAAFVNPPGNITVACGGAPAPTCLAYTNGGGAGCLIAGCVTSTRTATPGLCGGVITETWSFTDECQRNISHSRTITVEPAAIAAFVNPPGNITVACGGAPAPTCLAYTNGRTAGGCLIAGCVTSTRTATPGLCGGVITETWSFTDECQRNITHSRTITVQPAAIAVFVNPPGNITVACGGAPAPTCLAYTNGGGAGCLIAGCVTSTRTATPGLCGGVITETWSFTDECQRNITHSRTITVQPAAIAAFVNPPGNITVACGGAPAPTCLAYTNGGGAGCLIAGCVTSTRTATPGLCGGVITETWSFTDECQRNITHSRTITVEPAAIAAFVNPPGNITVACGGAPAPTCLAYTNGRTAGGCLIAGCVTSTRTATPGVCGGTITETWTFVDECQRTISHSRTITVQPAAIAAFVNPPGNITVACGGAPAPTCLAYTNGGGAGCLIAGCVTSTRTATPGLCGGVITETWSFTDECQRNITHSRTITVQPATIAAFVNPPGNITVACGGAPAPTCLNYSNGAGEGCLIAGCVTSTRTATPGVCGGVITETWSFTDQCQRNITHSRTITVQPAAIAAFVNPPGNITVACGGAPAPTCLNYTNGGGAGCLIAGCVTSTRTATPGICGGTITETWSFTDECQRNISHSRTITVQPATIAAFVNPPGNIVTTICGVAPTPTCLAYTNGGGAGCLIAGCVTSTITGQNPANCGVYTETWTFTDQCGRTITHSRTITVPCCTACTYTQGAYGNPGGNGCVFPGPITTNQTQIMINALTSEPGNMKVFGRQDLNRYWIVRLTDVNQGATSNIFKMLPGGTSAKVFELDTYTGLPEFANEPAWPVAPLKPNNPKKGQIQNQLFGQTLTLYFNLKNNANLGGFILGDTLVTADAVCGSNNPIPGTEQKFGLPHAVVVYLANPANGYPNTVGGLFTLANDMLGGVNTGLDLSHVAGAVDKINNAFDDCRVLVGYLPYTSAPVSRALSNGMEVTAFPNPYAEDNFNLRINAPVSGETSIRLYTMEGLLVSETKSMVKRNTDQVVNIKVPLLYRTRLVYVVTIGNYNARGIVLNPN